MQRAKLTREEAALAALVARTMWGHIVQIMPNVNELPAIERTAFDDSIRFLYGANGGPTRIFYELYAKTRAHPDALRYVESVLAQAG
jgi:hypothetical protein